VSSNNGSLASAVDNLERVLGIELLTAFQAMEFLRPLSSSRPLQRLRRAFRALVPAWTSDRLLAVDLERAAGFLSATEMRRLVATLE
jgi:histidine ammonia-lyase